MEPIFTLLRQNKVKTFTGDIKPPVYQITILDDVFPINLSEQIDALIKKGWPTVKAIVYHKNYIYFTVVRNFEIKWFTDETYFDSLDFPEEMIIEVAKWVGVYQDFNNFKASSIRVNKTLVSKNNLRTLLLHKNDKFADLDIDDYSYINRYNSHLNGYTSYTRK